MQGSRHLETTWATHHKRSNPCGIAVDTSSIFLLASLRGFLPNSRQRSYILSARVLNYFSNIKLFGCM